MRSQTQLLGSAYRLQRLALERGKPDAERETGYQQRDEVRIEAALKQVQRRYDARVEKAIMTELLRRYRALPADQHLAQLDAVFGPDSASATVPLHRLYASHRPSHPDTPPDPP